LGEAAVLRRTRRSATVTALVRTSLLVLAAQDLHTLMDRQPRIAERIREVAREGIEKWGGTAKGDILTAEIEEAGRADEADLHAAP
jgi:voltage-gated potassium channel